MCLMLHLLTATIGTTRTCRHVCSPVAFGGKADSRLCALPEPNDVVDRVIASGLEPRTPKTVTSPEKFAKALGATRQRGCAIEDEESELGMACIAAPIRDDSGGVVAAVGVAGPVTRLSKKSIAAVMPHVIATADLVSARLGYRGRTQA